MLSCGDDTFTFDSANRLLKAGNHAYTYNAENVRIRNLCGDYDTTYTYNTNCTLSQLLTKTTNGIVTKYVYGLGLIGEEKAGIFKTYHFDYRGSTVAITNEAGTITDTFKYDTYGKLISRTGSSFVIFGYNGRDGVVTDKNGLIYMRARYYSPDMKRFVNADIIPGQISNAVTLNRYAYANGNPVSLIDPFGLAADRTGPTPLEAAYMASNAYNLEYDPDVDQYSYGDWKLVDDYINDEGLKICVFYKEINGVPNYVIANAGSMFKLSELNATVQDWKNNFEQLFGCSQDMEDSIKFARDFVEKHPNANITFVGHSKGGAEAEAMAIATKKDAILFNPAKANYLLYGVSGYKYNANMTSYVVEGEALSTAYTLINILPVFASDALETKNELDDFLTIILPIALNMSPFKGEVIPLPKQEGNAIYNHLMNAVINALS